MLSALTEFAYKSWLSGMAVSLLTLVALGIWTFIPALGRARRTEFQRILGADEMTLGAAGCFTRFAFLATASWLGFSLVIYILFSGAAKDSETWIKIRSSLKRVEWKFFLVSWAAILLLRWKQGLSVVFWTS